MGDAADTTRDALLDAVLVIAEDLDLDRTLRRIVRAARSLVDARYGALGVLADDGSSLATFIHDGIDDETAARIGPLPTGHGVLGEVIRTGTPLRLARLSAHPSSSPLPAGHPSMTTFLGVPVVVGDAVYGNLYLTDKPGGFDDADGALVVALAAIAGAAIRNARVARNVTLRERAQRAAAQLATAVVGGAAPDEVLALTTSALGWVVEDATVSGPDPDVHARAGDVVADLGGGHGRLRIVPDPGRRPLDADEREVLAMVARQGGLALAYADARDRAAALTLAHERSRIARDLHDTVIQRIFGAGLRLDAVTRQLDPGSPAADTLEAVLRELDLAIADLRATIASLAEPDAPALGDQLDAVVAALRPVCTGLTELTVVGDLSAVPATIAADLPAVLREALANAARHAHAATVEPRLEVTATAVMLTVTDDGPGPSASVAQSRGSGLGLRNLADRAAAHGGSCVLERRDGGGGAELRWSAQLDDVG